MKSWLLFIFLISIIIFTSVVSAQNCDYYDYEEYEVEELRSYRNSQLLDGNVEITETQIVDQTHVNFKVYNPHDFDIDVRISYKTKSNWYGNGAGGASGHVASNEYVIFESQHNTAGSVTDIKLEVTNPEGIIQKLEKVTKQKEICKNCVSNEIFCDSDDKCVSKNVVPLNVKPQCGLYQECVSQYINPDTGNCEKSPAQIQEEENQRLKEEIARKEKERKFLIFSIIGLVSFIIIGGIIIYVLKYKNEKEKQNTLQKEIELEAKKIQSKEFELNELKKQIAQIKKHRKLEKKEIEKLNNLKSKRDILIHDIKKQYQDITKPFPDSQAKNRMVVINPYLGGYKCFYKEGVDLENYPTSSLLHRWVWKKYNGRNPKQGYHIHHIDEDKYNNDPRNLEEIPGDEHYEKHRYK